ncbi:TatD family hydrolase [Solemya velum gill symbiont]|uniref:TatD family hydrolase n=1 Tax=Solemya velum gill symbiont TaxID=2340 RepID=UPI000997E0BB|nr:TatD family hydrolase [Solemya velum gill symbiont]OOZ00213.1 hypothetical protein BOW19_01750 [Solemya velum gill symbiont]OOZ02371.1 hypothetical protein BOW20_01745 [Solemya velum gill symbiont]OOZ04728.1 hypothetical protein BOW21_01755 [Solemya velum gill symbiont]OOZ06967.1 hypothetical protein BOW22_01740 [Solemya velum gill symbiont]OOZ09150.1 hypothetical protein BOW23_01735 [Solemya velum gill symbiont]
MIDSHCHLDFEEFDRDRDAVLTESANAGVTDLVIPGTTADSWLRTLHLCREHPFLHAALGLHPYFMDQHQAPDIDRLRELLVEHGEVVAVGEIGLDFALSDPDRNHQKKLVQQQLEIAAEIDLPVILHVRKAHDEMIQLLKKTPIRGGTVHAFNGSLQQAGHYQALGFCLGFGGMLTYPHSRRLHTLASQVSCETIVLETDAPDMTGFNHHGERNSPAYLPEVRDEIAKLRNESPDEVERYTTENARRVFNLPGDSQAHV